MTSQEAETPQTQSTLINQVPGQWLKLGAGGVGLLWFCLQRSPRGLHRCFRPVRPGKVRTSIHLLPKRP